MIILVDSREKKPYWKRSPNVEYLRIDVGDYTTKNLLGIYHIERKSLTDLYGTLTQGRIRFLKQIYRAKLTKIKMDIVVEGSKDAFLNKRFPRGGECNCPEDVLLRRLYNIAKLGVEIHWVKNRSTAANFVRKRLKEKEVFYEC